MRKKLVHILAVSVASLCVLAFLATCAALILMDANLALPFLVKLDGVGLLLACGTAFLLLCMVAFSLYVTYRRRAHSV